MNLRTKPNTQLSEEQELQRAKELSVIHKKKLPKKDKNAPETEEEKAERLEKEEVILKAQKQIEKLKKKNINVPIEVFPIEIQEFILNHYNYYKYPLDYYFGSVLSVAGTAIGNAYSAKYHTDWEGVGLFWIVLVGGSSIGKTQVINPCVKPLKELQEQQIINNDKAVAQMKAIGNWKEENLPKPKRIITSKSTNQQMITLMKKNPKGVLLCRSEAKGLMKSMNQYSPGDDLENLMEWWDNTFWSDDKKGEGYTYLLRPFIGMLTGIQTKIVKQMGAGDNADNGFFPRILFCVPMDESKPMPVEGEPNAGPYVKYAEIIKALFKLDNLIDTEKKNNKAGHEKIESVQIPLSEKAKKAFFKYRTQSAIKQNRTEDDVTKSSLGKLETYVLRFAITLQLLDYITKKDQYSKPLIDLVREGKYEITEKTLLNAIKVADYFEQTGKVITNKLDNPLDDLKPIQQSWYENLNEEQLFTRKEALELAAGITKVLKKEGKDYRGLGKRTANELLSRKDLFHKHRTMYEKVILSDA